MKNWLGQLIFFSFLFYWLFAVWLFSSPCDLELKRLVFDSYYSKSTSVRHRVIELLLALLCLRKTPDITICFFCLFFVFSAAQLHSILVFFFAMDLSNQISKGSEFLLFCFVFFLSRGGRGRGIPSFGSGKVPWSI